MNRGRGRSGPYRSFGGGGRGGFRASGQSRGRGGFYSRRGFDGASERGRSRGRGDTSYTGRRYESDRFKETPSMYSARDYDRPARRALTPSPPPPVDRGYGSGDHDLYRFDRYSSRVSEYRRDSIELRGSRDFDDRRDFPRERSRPYMDMLDYPLGRDYDKPISRDYMPPSTGRRYSPDMRDITSRRDVRDMSPPRRDYEPLPRSRAFGGSRGTVAAGRGYRNEAFARQSPPTFDGPYSREVRTQRMSPPRFDRTRKMSPPRFDRDDYPPMKRGRGGGRTMTRGPRRYGGFAPRHAQSRRF